uniref:Histidine--tRNA ligase n=1 Tax=uncultured alpha proteobacterium HF0070_05I22 TaxID=710803 RepID=E0XX64_9PROT|nr:histidyl-tRNA synthetase [uncultured alpha proteobacterium HF0070_05I22]
MSKLQPVRGTADLLPDLMAQHRLVIDTARNATARYGFQEMATPILEFSEVFSRPLGNSSDIVTKENYSFVDRGGEQLTLRPENTAGVVRAMISGGLTQSLPLKYFYAGPMFRYERPQKGRMRQFHQVGIEYLGPNDALADAEVISAGARFLAELGVLPHCVLHLNSLGDAESRAAYRAALVGFLQTHESALSDDSKRRLAVNPLRILDSKEAGDRDILQTAPKLQDYLNAASKAHFQTLTTALDAAGVTWVFDPFLVRGLDYYCHTAFEFVTDALGTQGTVLAGGRYDGLAEMLGGPAVAGTGWAAGIERLAMLAGDAAIAAPQVAMLSTDPETDLAAFQLAEKLRDTGIDIEFPTAGAIGKKLKKAARSNIRLAIILGGDELAKNTLQLRDLTTGTQAEIAMADLADAVAAALVAP